MQLDPFKPKLKAPGTILSTLNYDEPLSSFAFDFNLRRYTKEYAAAATAAAGPGPWDGEDLPVHLKEGSFIRTLRMQLPCSKVKEGGYGPGFTLNGRVLHSSTF